MKQHSIAIAGSTEHTRMCAQALFESELFDVKWVLTPQAKPVGREQLITKNPLLLWSELHSIPSLLVEQKIDQKLHDQVTEVVGSVDRPDFLLVVDFGYLVPTWLLEVPKVASLNIHPSKLPRWRGSSPGQFVLLTGEKESAITLMEMDAGLDTGPIIFQLGFTVNANWTQSEYYQFAFSEICKLLPEKIAEFAESGVKTAQPKLSPTVIARKLAKPDGYINWNFLKLLMEGTDPDGENTLSSIEIKAGESVSTLLTEVQKETQQSWPQIIEQASRALQPWPILWTLVPTKNGEKRMQILKCELGLHGELILVSVKIEGGVESSWNATKNHILVI